MAISSNTPLMPLLLSGRGLSGRGGGVGRGVTSLMLVLALSHRPEIDHYDAILRHRPPECFNSMKRCITKRICHWVHHTQWQIQNSIRFATAWGLMWLDARPPLMHLMLLKHSGGLCLSIASSWSISCFVLRQTGNVVGLEILGQTAGKSNTCNLD